jgi:predicted ATPase
LRLVNFKSYDDYEVKFTEGNSIQRVVGLFGPNGTGKSTMLEAIGMLFGNYCGSDRERIMTSLKKYVRNVENMDVAGCSDESRDNFQVADDKTFVVEGDFIVEDGTSYTVRVSNEPSFFKWSNGSPDGVAKDHSERPVVSSLVDDHPPAIKRTLTSQCYTTSYDKELNKFQLRKDRWSVFKRLFEAVTGFPVDKVDIEFDEETKSEESDVMSMAYLEDYVLGIKISKPFETITERQCSDGEKKIIKNFTTLLNKECVPSIILIDNIEMHVEVDRHMNLLECVRACFPDSQIVYTTHSERIISEANLNELVSLVNKNIPRSQTWRQSILRVLKGFKVSFRDQKSQSMCGSLSAKLVDEGYCDIEDAKSCLAEIVKHGSLVLESEIEAIGT